MSYASKPFVYFVAVVVESKVWVLDRKVFQQIMVKTGLQRLQDNIKFLRSVPLLQNLSNELLAKIADVLEVVSLFFFLMSLVILCYFRNFIQLVLISYVRELAGILSLSLAVAVSKLPNVFQVPITYFAPNVVNPFLKFFAS